MAATRQRSTIAAEGAAKAREIGLSMYIAICDERGVLTAFSRRDGAALLTVDSAPDKASTIGGFGPFTDRWGAFSKNAPPLHQVVVNYPRLNVCGGGIDVSGGHDTQALKIARTGLAAPGVQL